MPLYETEFDLENERKASVILGKVWNCTPVKLPHKEKVDWSMERDNRTKAIAEIKTRSNSKDKYPTFYISLKKWMSGLQMSEAMSKGKERVPFLVIANWTDGMYWHEAGSTTDLEFGVNGKKVRGDIYDEEIVVYIPTQYFTKIEPSDLDRND